ncbi:MAG: DUF285 domain-containing protein [Succinivibrionaceae bacterium]|nr:DUF285 domain-containing protein [Succinivibrionaceae bacterium]
MQQGSKRILMSRIAVPDGGTLRRLVRFMIEKDGPHCDLSRLDVSRVADMSGLFEGMDFQGDISGWDVSHVTSMARMFKGSTFNGDISGWDVSKVVDMSHMFAGDTSFSGDLSGWRVGKGCLLEGMLEGCAGAVPPGAAE